MAVPLDVALRVIEQASDSLEQTVTSLDSAATVLLPNMAVVVDKSSPEQIINSTITTPQGQVTFIQLNSASPCLLIKVQTISSSYII